MSLKVWLPLMGNLDNKGITNVNFTLNNVTYDTNGKIGACASFNGSSSNIQGTTALFDNNTNDWSYACWFKPNAQHKGCLFSHRTTSSDAGITLFYYDDRILFDDGKRWTFTPSIAITVNKWNHLAFVRKKGVGKFFYLNGQLIDSTTETKTSTAANATYFAIGGSQTQVAVSGNWLNGYLNDVRIYDHALSTTEVHEIAQGLVLHYKFDNTEENLNWLVNGADETYIQRTNANTFRDYAYKPELLTCPATSYRVDFDAKGTANDLRMDIYFRNASGSSYARTPYIPITTEWKHYTSVIDGTTEALDIFRTRCLSGTAGDYIYLRNMRLTSDYMPLSSGEISDSSGYGHTGIISGNVCSSVDGGRHMHGIFIPSGNTDFITTKDEVGNFNEGITMNIWFRSQNTTPGSDYHEIFNIATATQEYEFAIHKTGYFRAGMKVNGTRYVTSLSSITTLLNNNWHMLTMTYDGTSIKRYIDGVFQQQTNVTGTPSATSCKFMMGHYGTKTSFYAAEARLSDARIYCTPLLDNDIKLLYNTSMKINKFGGIHTFTLNETPENTITKSGMTTAAMMCENARLTYLKYDKDLYFEPDGSVWAHIFHHNNPSNGVFNSTDDFNNSVYLDKDRWFNVQVTNQLSAWEFLVKTKLTVDGEEKKFRWIQPANPMTCSYTDVPANLVTWITTDGYSNVRQTCGGIFKKNKSAFIVLDNNTSGANWWGAIGACSFYQSGIPGFLTSVLTTGYLDLYVRIDNQSFTDITTAANSKYNIWFASNLIES